MAAKGLYIVSEQGCLTPNSGANKHINVGLRELKRYFDIKLFLLFHHIIDQEAPQVISGKINKKPGKITQSSYVKGTLKDIYGFYTNHKKFFRYYREIKLLKPEFIYERASYMNFTGLIISKMLRIPHFYEVNGIHSEEIKVYYKSWLNTVIRKFILYSYKKSNGVFFMGAIRQYLGIENKNAYSVENGVEKDVVEKFISLKKNKSEIIKVVFVGHAMQHHGLALLSEAINNIKYSRYFEFIFIGRDTEKIEPLIRSDIKTKFLGVKPENEIYNVLVNYDIGIIPATPEYASNMKLFLYGASKLCVIAPDAYIFKHTFKNDEVLFFKNRNLESLVETLDGLIESRMNYNIYGEKLFALIEQKYTWDKIFRFKTDIMTDIIQNT